MSERLQFFRQQIAAFEGAARPELAIEKGYYVAPPQTSLSKQLTEKIALRPSSSHLVIGGIGSGKTTELLVTKQNIIDNYDDIEPVYFDISSYVGMDGLKPGLLVAIIGVILLEQLNGFSGLTQEVDDIETFAYGQRVQPMRQPTGWEAAYVGRKSNELRKGGILLETESTLQKTLESIKKIREGKRKAVFLIDGMDRIGDFERFFDVTYSDIQSLSSIGIGLTLVAPPLIVYDERFEVLRSCFDVLLNQSCFDVERSLEVQNFFISVVETRTEEDFFHPNAIKKLVQASGGIFRDLIGLAQSSIEEAYSYGADKVMEQYVNDAVRTFGYSQLMTISPSSHSLLDRMISDHENGRKPSLSNGILPLLRSQKVLEYTYPRKRYVIHPSIRAIWDEFKQEVY